MEKVVMIALTPTMDAGTIAKWSKKESDTVAQGDLLCEVETDKSSMEYESLNSGTLLKIIVGEGQTAKVGDVIAIVGKPGEDISAALASLSGGGASSAPAAAPSAPVAPASSSAGAAPSASAAAATSGATSGTTSGTKGRVSASPLARKTAESRGIDIALVAGSGPGGRILKSDVENFSPGAAGAQSVGAFAAPSAADVEIPLSGIRAVIAKRLSESKFSAPHFYVKVVVRVEKIIELRNAVNENLQKQKKEKLSMNAFFIKIAAEALKRHPAINSSWQGTKILQFGSVDIGLAVDLGKGLLTPVVRGCASKGLERIDAELQALIGKVKNGTIAQNEYTGATFTISNLGSFGVDEFTAIINPPGSAILAVGRTRRELEVLENGTTEVAQVMTLTLSCDHRVIDGMAAAKFISDLKALFENPALALA